MSRPIAVEVQCPACGLKSFETVWTSVNVTIDPGLRDRLLAGELNVLHCSCGVETELQAGLLYHDMVRKLMVWLKFPEDSGIVKFDGTVLKLVDQTLPSYRRRLVRSRNQLLEKILMFDHDLDDRVMEVLKGIVLNRWARKEGSADTQLFFAGVSKRFVRSKCLLFSLIDDLGREEILRVPREQGYNRTRDLIASLPLMAQSEDRGWEVVGREFGELLAVELAEMLST